MAATTAVVVVLLLLVVVVLLPWGAPTLIPHTRRRSLRCRQHVA